MLSFNDFYIIESLTEEVSEESLFSKIFFETLEEFYDSDSFEILTEKEISHHSGNQPWSEFSLSKEDALKYQQGDKEAVERINKELDAEKDKYVTPIKNRFTSTLKSVGAVVSNAKILVDVKSNKSIVSKVIRKTPFGRMKDILRSAIIVRNQEDIPKIMNAMRKKFNLYQLKTKEKHKDEFGYYGSYHYIVDFNGVLIEVQLMTARLWRYKELGHEVYDRWREEIAKNANLLNNPLYAKDIAFSKRIFSRGNGANVRF